MLAHSVLMRHVIFGNGGHGREVADMLRRCLPAAENICFAVDGGGEPIFDLAVLDTADLGAGDMVYVAIGSGRAREEVERRLIDRGCEIGTAVAATALVSLYAVLGAGALVSDFTMINAAATVGRQFQCNMYAYVAHDCRIGDFVTFAPGVQCNGNVTIGDHAYIGSGAVIRQNIRIGRGATVGMGAVVVADVPDFATVVGNPARPMQNGAPQP
jgi:sugar O-acyltransferase (sialic acid O-acetyltransferase NeuD family)